MAEVGPEITSVGCRPSLGFTCVRYSLLLGALRGPRFTDEETEAQRGLQLAQGTHLVSEAWRRGPMQVVGGRAET